MATVVNNPQPSMTDRTYVERTSDSSAGWAIAIILLVVLVGLGLYFWVRSSRYAAPATAGTPTTNINVSAPGDTGATSPATPSSGDTGTAGASDSGSASGAGTLTH